VTVMTQCGGSGDSVQVAVVILTACESGGNCDCGGSGDSELW
jgi:hypothetical protein